MATVHTKKPVAQAPVTTQRVFIGRAWKNRVQKEGATKGVEFLNLQLDRDVSITLEAGDRITLWPNTKREGKADADYRASIQVPA